MAGARFWLRWSWRDLRQRWLLVTAIALVIAVGTGLSTGLGSVERWRLDSADRSYAALDAHDLRVSLGAGSFARRGELARAAAAVPQRAVLAHFEERLVVPTQVDASGRGTTVLTPGRLVGLAVGRGEPSIDRLAVDCGRSLGPGDDGRPRAVLEASYAKANHLPAERWIRVAGGRELRYVGQGRSPDTFVVVLPGGLWIAPGSYGVVFTLLATAQRLSGREGAVNELVVDLRPGVDGAALATPLERALAVRLPGYGPSVTALVEEEGRRIIYEDARNDQEVFDILALLVLGGAAFAAFNLAARIIDPQRREMPTRNGLRTFRTSVGGEPDVDVGRRKSADAESVATLMATVRRSGILSTRQDEGGCDGACCTCARRRSDRDRGASGRRAQTYRRDRRGPRNRRARALPCSVGRRPRGDLLPGW